MPRKDKKEKLNPEDVKSVIQAIARMERILQNYERQLGRNGMDFAVLQEYSLSLGGTEEGYKKLHQERMAEAQAAAQEQIQEVIKKHTGPEILDLGGKPLVLDTTPPENLAPPPGKDIVLERDADVEEFVEKPEKGKK